MEAKRWCFTINNPIADEEREDNDRFWDNTPGSDSMEPMINIDYLILQEERGEQGTLHWQGFLILKKKKRLTWLKRHLNARAHWEIARGTNEQARDYCRKTDTYTGGFRLELGKLPEREAPKRGELLIKAADNLDAVKEGFVRPREIDTFALLQPGFIPAYKELTADVLGPYRPNLKIVTLIGPPGCGKSYAIQHFYPGHGRCIVGNNGVWFQQPLADVMVFEEFAGQIQLQRMLQYLDPYPLALEIKGGMRPAMYTTVVITSNTSPNGWYKITDVQGGQDDRRLDALRALWDRLGYSNGSYIPVRTCGHYIECPQGLTVAEQRQYIWSQLAALEMRNPMEDATDDEAAQP